MLPLYKNIVRRQNIYILLRLIFIILNPWVVMFKLEVYEKMRNTYGFWFFSVYKFNIGSY